MSSFREELTAVINRWSKENGSDTPDFILALYLERCLQAYDETVLARDRWYGFKGLSRQNVGIASGQAGEAD